MDALATAGQDHQKKPAHRKETRNRRRRLRKPDILNLGLLSPLTGFRAFPAADQVFEAGALC